MLFVKSRPSILNSYWTLSIVHEIFVICNNVYYMNKTLILFSFVFRTHYIIIGLYKNIFIFMQLENNYLIAYTTIDNSQRKMEIALTR